MALRADDVDLGRDRVLVEQFQAGDAAGFEDLYRRYYARLYRFCLKRVGDTTEAEEVTQEAFARAYSAMPRLAGERRFYPWISVIAARLCSDTHRRRARSIPLPELDLGSVEGVQESEVLAAEDRAHLAQALDRLGPRHREVLHLREQQGWSYQRIAEYYEVSLGTVEQLLWRSRRALRREFEAVAGPDARGLAAVPVVAWVLRRLTSVRARLDGWSGHAIAPLATNAVSMVVAVTSAVVLVGPMTNTPAPVPPSGAVPVVDIGRVVPATAPSTSVAPPAQAPPAAPAPQTRPSAGRGGDGAGTNPPIVTVGPQERQDDPEVRADSPLIGADANPQQVSSKVAGWANQILGGGQ